MSKLHRTCLYLANVRQMASPEWQTSDSSSLLIYRPRKDERLSWPSWLTCSGRCTPAGFKGPTSEGRGGVGSEGKEGEGRGRGGMGRGLIRASIRSPTFLADAHAVCRLHI